MSAPRPPNRRTTTWTTRAFLFSDLRDYTSFVEAQGDAAAARLLREYRTIVRREVARHDGAEVKTEGDSFYVVFERATSALECAVAILRSAQARNAKPGAAQLRIGIGLHAGEAVAYDDQFVGSAVNIASRLASKAAPMELLVSDTLRGLVRTSQSFPMTERGPLELKGVTEPIRAWSVRWSDQAVVDAGAPQVALAGAPASADARSAAATATAVRAASALPQVRLVLSRRGRWLVAIAALAAVLVAVLIVQPFRAPSATLVAVVGAGTVGFSGDGGPGLLAQIDDPTSLGFDQQGHLFFADSYNQLSSAGVYAANYTHIRRLDVDGTISTIAGGGQTRYSATDSGATLLTGSRASIAVAADGTIYISSTDDLTYQGFVTQVPIGHWVARIDPSGRFQVVVAAGASGLPGYTGDGGDARSATVASPSGLAIGSDGGLYIADSGNNAIRVVSSGVITTIAGDGTRGYAGDGGPASRARFFAPLAVALSGDGSLYISDTNNNVVRKVDHGGTITTIAGDGTAGLAGDGGPATKARLSLPSGIALGRDGVLYIADTGNARVRAVRPDGTITTVAGPDVLRSPVSVAVAPDGALYIGDSGAHRIYRLALPQVR